MATAEVDKPVRDLAWLRRESRPIAVVALALGAVSILSATLGVAVVIWAHGLTPLEELVRGFKSNEMTGITLWAIVVGAAAAILGWGVYRRMPTKASREEAVAGAV